MQFELTKDLLADLRKWIGEGKDSAIHEFTKDLHPADVAEIINELPTQEGVYLYRILDEESAADVMLELDEDIQETLLSNLTSREIAEELIENIDSDDAADVLAGLSEEKQEEVIALLEDEEQASDIMDLMTYEEGTAGAIMAVEMVTVHEDWTVAQAIREMRKQAEYIDNIYSIYVIDENDHMLGILSMKALIFASASMRATLKDLYKESKVRTVDVNTTVEEVMRIMKKYDLVVLPVLDEEKKLVGRITIDDVVDLMQEVSDRDYQLASGISEDVESSDSIWTLTRARLPWLLIGMIGGMSGAYIIGVFDITEYPAMAVFMPLIAATGGNVGVQSAALVVRALANQSAFDETVWQKLVKEFGVGLLNAAVCSALIFLASQLFHFELLLSLTVSLALFCVIIFASLSGTFFPLMLDKLKIDPALATGPFVTTANDIVGLIIYFSVGHYFLTHFTSLPHSLF